jgi:ATP adenylyltransferase
MSTHVNLNNAHRPKDDTYQKAIEKIKSDSVCPFCREHLSTYHKKPILKESAHWIVTTNMYAYENAKYHFLFIHKEHITNTNDMTPEAFVELQEHIDWVTEEYKCPGGTLMMRCGDTSITGATVTHIHAHFIVADFDNAQREPLVVRVG